jgi:hypothetical protein
MKVVREHRNGEGKREGHVRRVVGVRGFVGLSLLIGLAACHRDGESGGDGAKKRLPALSKAVAAEVQAEGFTTTSTPGEVPCGAAACPVAKGSRKMCCNAPGVPPTCKTASKCGQATQFRYSGLLECNEAADCGGKGSVCCLTDDGNKAESSTDRFNRAACMPQRACVGRDAVACTSTADCGKGTVCRKTSLGGGIELGACLP